MRLRIGIGMARMSTLCHKSRQFASYIIYGNALVTYLLEKRGITTEALLQSPYDQASLEQEIREVK
jgi:hypothetical protein